MTQKTVESVNKKALAAYHRLALGLYEGYIASRGRSVHEEIREYCRILAAEDPEWSNILKTKQQKTLAINRMADAYCREFGADTEQFKEPSGEDL